jgi:hypothetical protein
MTYFLSLYPLIGFYLYILRLLLLYIDFFIQPFYWNLLLFVIFSCFSGISKTSANNYFSCLLKFLPPFFSTGLSANTSERIINNSSDSWCTCYVSDLKGLLLGFLLLSTAMLRNYPTISFIVLESFISTYSALSFFCFMLVWLSIYDILGA